MSRYVDYPAEGAPVGRCVVLPGRQYTADRPLLFFATEVASMRGWEVRQVWWEPPARDRRDISEETSWVCDQLDAAVDGYDGSVLIVAKSLGTLAAARAAERDYDAVWLTPLLGEPDVAEVLLTYPGRQLSVIGSEDPYFRRAVFDALPGERLLVAGDHVLRVPGDPVAMVASHGQFVRSFDAWLAAERP
ncbi:MAG: hypothetical protein QM638_00600 [Nocardioides sp.]|uniref:hypothetical protein n=1 Tax=Nocardioides sp. TaxID=35761 RepID=UPI0039E49F35